MVVGVRACIYIEIYITWDMMVVGLGRWFKVDHSPIAVH